jgi:hypothetical protein
MLDQEAGVRGFDQAGAEEFLGGITASFGFASLPDHAGTGDELVRAADGALYGAKAASRGRVGVAGAAVGGAGYCRDWLSPSVGSARSPRQMQR